MAGDPHVARRNLKGTLESWASWPAQAESWAAAAATTAESGQCNEHAPGCRTGDSRVQHVQYEHVSRDKRPKSKCDSEAE